jgi:DNA-binding MarR family transcriptional regulator
LLINQLRGGYDHCRKNRLDSMRRPQKVNPVPPLLHRSDAGGPLLRELTSLRLVRLVDFMNHTAARAFPRVSGLSRFEWRAVALACGTPLLSINDLAARLHRGAAQVSRTVKKLVAAGLLHRASRTGGPGVLISPTSLGRTVYGPLEQLARERNAALVAGLTTDELKVLDRCISVMTANAIALLAQEERLQGREVDPPP